MANTCLLVVAPHGHVPTFLCIYLRLLFVYNPVICIAEGGVFMLRVVLWLVAFVKRSGKVQGSPRTITQIT